MSTRRPARRDPQAPTPACRALACGNKIRVEQGGHGRHPEGLFQARLPPQPMGLTLQGQWPFLGETPHGHRSVSKGQTRGASAGQKRPLP